MTTLALLCLTAVISLAAHLNPVWLFLAAVGVCVGLGAAVRGLRS